MAKRGRPRKTEFVEDNVENKDTSSIEDAQIEEVQTEATSKDAFEQPEKPTPPSDSGVIGDGTKGDYNPFAESVVERDYSTPKVASVEVPDIDEPAFVPPSSYEEIIGQNEQNSEEGDGSNPFDNPNPALNDLDSGDKKIACESMVDTALDAYEQLHRFAQHSVKVDEDELLQKQIEGKLDLNEQIPISENGDTMSVSEFVGQFNQQSEQALSYDKDFGYKVRPAMVRVFMKKGWGMSDEQYLLYMFGRDVATKLGIMYSLKKTMSSTLALLEKAHKQNKGGQDYEEAEVYEDEPEYEDSPQPSPPPPTQAPVADDERTDSEIVDEEGSFNQKLDINMPQRPTPTSHPKEIRAVLSSEKKGTRKRKKK